MIICDGSALPTLFKFSMPFLSLPPASFKLPSAQIKSDGSPRFLLPDGCAIRRVAAGGDMLNPDGDDITPTKLTVDCQIEHGEVASRPSIWSFVRLDQTCLGLSGGLAPVSLPLFQGTCL